MEITIINEQGSEASKVEVSDCIFKSEVNKNALYEAIKNELANKRQGTHSTKGRGDVSGGGKKPWRQKGTGRARAGTRRSPIWVGGAKIHTPHPRDYSYSIPRKIKRNAFLSVFSMKHEASRVKVVEDFVIDTPKTGRMVEFLGKTKSDGVRKITFIVGKSEELKDNYVNLLLSLRNIKDLKIVNADSLSIHPLFYADEVYITKTALEKMNAIFGAKEA